MSTMAVVFQVQNSSRVWSITRSQDTLTDRTGTRSINICFGGALPDSLEAIQARHFDKWRCGCQGIFGAQVAKVSELIKLVLMCLWAGAGPSPQVNGPRSTGMTGLSSGVS